VSRLLGIDLGERRIGFAIAEGDGALARPLTTVQRRPEPAQDAAAVRDLIERHAIDELVIGLPLHANGAEGRQAEAVRTWADAIRSNVTVPITFRDERLSSHLAESRLGPMKRGRSGGPPTRTQRDQYRARVDREAAAIILQDELDARAEAGTAIVGSGGIGPERP
jgi:putative Holliday junction resolvase